MANRQGASFSFGRTGKSNLLGTEHAEWLKRLSVSDTEREDMIRSLIRNIGTTQRQAYNRGDEIAAAGDLPLATRLSMKRGTDIGTQEAIGEGIEGIERYASGADRDAWSQILRGELSETQMEKELKAREDAQDEAFWADLLKNAGRGAAMYAGI